MSVLPSAAHHAAALAVWPAAQRALGWPLALALTLAWLAAAERATRRQAVLEAQRDWEARPCDSPFALATLTSLHHIRPRSAARATSRPATTARASPWSG